VDRIDLSVIINLHNEKELVLPTLGSIRNGMEEVKRFGNRIELVIVFDDADSETKNITKGFFSSNESSTVVFLEVDFGDLGLARNAGIEKSRGEFIGLCDGDDLYSENWFLESLNVAKSYHQPENVVVHPEVALTFGRESALRFHVDTNELSSRKSTNVLFFRNLWVSGCLASRRLFLASKFKKTGDHFGYEDWGWYADLTANRVDHVIAARTSHFIRKKHEKKSLAELTSAKKLLPDIRKLSRLRIVDERKSSSYFSPRLQEILSNLREAYATTLAIHYLRRFLSKYSPKYRRKLNFRYQAPPSYMRLNHDVYRASLLGEIDANTHFNVYSKIEQRPVWVSSMGLGQAQAEVGLVPELSRHCSFPTWLAVSASQQSKFERKLSISKLNPPLPVNNFREEFPEISAAESRTLRSSDLLILVPWLKPGGADFAIVQIALQAKLMGLSPVILSTTEGVEETWQKVLDSNQIPVIQKPLSKFTPETQALFISQLIFSSELKWVHIMNSEAGWNLLDFRIRGALHDQGPKISVSLFCHDYDSSGVKAGYLSKLPTTKENIDFILTDNGYLSSLIRSEYEIDNIPIFQLRHPINCHEQTTPYLPSSSSSPKVVWASRPVAQKNIKLAFQVLSRLEQTNLEVHWASVDDLQDSEIAEYSKVRDRVMFSSSQRTLIDMFSGQSGVFFYTSLWDGLPNVVLEALGAGLFVVAPRLPGLLYSCGDELIDYYSHDDHLDSIAAVLDNALRRASNGMNVAGIEFVAKQHSLKSFSSDIRNFLSVERIIKNKKQ